MNYTYYVVSDTWMGRSEIDAADWQAAAMAVYNEVYSQKQAELANRSEAERKAFEVRCAQRCTEPEEQDAETLASMVQPEQFRAWPAADWPHDLAFAEAFDWIGEQKTAQDKPRGE